MGRLIDKGGARIRDEQTLRPPRVRTKDFLDRVSRDRPEKKPSPRVRVKVEETHDGEACECITKEMTVEIGQSIELEHVCHDGRVDIVRATVISVE